MPVFGLSNRPGRRAALLGKGAREDALRRCYDRFGECRTAWQKRLVVASAATALFVVSLPAFAGPEDSADERRMQGQTLFEQGVKLAESNPKGALAAFRLAHEIRPDFNAHYNIGRICVRLKDDACARTAFEQYLKEGGGDIPAKRRKEVEAELKSLGASGAAKAATALVIKASVSGAYVKVDGVVVGRTPLDKPVPVSAGAHKVVLVADGSVIEKSATVASGATESVEFEVKKDDPPAPLPAAPPPAPEPASAPVTSKPSRDDWGGSQNSGANSTSTSRHVLVLPWVVTGALAAGTVVAGVLTARAYSEYDSMRDDFPVSRSALDQAHTRAKNLLLVTSILGASTLLAGSLSGYFTLSGGGAPAEKTVGLSVGPSGVSVAGRIW